MRGPLSCVLILIIPLLITVRADTAANTASQQTSEKSSSRIPTIHSAANLVLVPVSVTDPAGNPAENLRVEDFAVLDNGKTVLVQHLGRPELTRLEIILLFDVTSSVWFHFDIVKEAAAGFVKSLFRSGDAVSVIGISSQPEIMLQRTESLPSVLDGLNRLRRGAATAFFDAVVRAAHLFPERLDPESRRIIVVLSDGEDNLSTGNLENALEEVQKADSLFYSINPGASPERLNNVSRRGQQWMEFLAEQTGGVAFLAESFEDLGGIYDRIAEELRVQYLLSYYAPGTDSDHGFRTISVALPNRPELKIRARKIYYPGASKTSH